MLESTHRIRTEQTKFYRRLIISLFSIIIAVFVLIFIGLPLLAKIILLTTPQNKESLQKLEVESIIIFPPVLDPIFEATNSSRISISGTGEKESKVKIYINNKEKTTVQTDKEGKFKTPDIVLKDGPNEITATTLKNNKESSPSTALSVIYSKEPPSIEIISPSDNEKFSGDNREIAIVGETDPNNKIMVNERFTIVSSSGKFNHRVTLQDGDNTFKVTAIDQAGNTTTIEKKVRYIP